MFIAAIVVSFALGIYENGIQCSTIRYRVEDINSVKNLTYTRGNLSFPKKFENQKSKNVTEIFPFNKIEKNYDERILISDKKREPTVVGKRRPKFFGSLAFGTGTAKQANVAPSIATNLFGKLSNGAVSLYFTLPGYFAGFYNPQQLIPYPYPVLQYPAGTAAASLVVNKNPENLANEILNVASSPLTVPLSETDIPKRISNSTNDKVPSLVVNATATLPEGNDQPTETQISNNEVQTNREPAATEVESKRILLSEEKNDAIGNIDSPVVGEETGLRLFGFGETTTTTTTTTAAPNTTVPTMKPMKNTTGSNIPFYGYYGGFPQDVGHVLLTTEDPQQRYLKDYAEEIFPLPFERPAIFNPYQNIETYSSPFVNSFSPAERFPEFLNTVESDRYLYDAENRRSFNGFRPILK